MAKDKALLAYQQLGLQDRPALDNVEAAIKLLVERGKFIPESVRYFTNADFVIKSQDYNLIRVDKTGPLIEPQRILVTDAMGESVELEQASIETFGKLQNLANGQAFLQNYPGAQQRLSVAEKILIHLHALLNRFKGYNDQVLITNNYQIQRKGRTLTLRQPFVSPNGDKSYTNDPHTLLLKEDQGHLILSYLSTTDILQISHAYQLIDNFDPQEILFQLNEKLNLVPQSIIPHIDSTAVSLNEMHRSWTLPQGGVKTNEADIPTTLATYESALALVNAKQNTVFGTYAFEINKDEDSISIRDDKGREVFEHSLLFPKVYPTVYFSTETAYQIMVACSQNLPELLTSTISETRAQELLRHTQYLTLDSESHSNLQNEYTVVRNGDIVQVFDQDQILVLSGNRVSGEILENCISEVLAEKIIGESIYESNYHRNKLQNEHATPAMRFALAVFNHAALYLQSGDSVLSRHAYDLIVDDLVPDSVRFGGEPYPGPQWREGLTLRQLWDEWQGFNQPQPTYDAINWNFIEPFKTTVKTAELATFENAIEQGMGYNQEQFPVEVQGDENNVEQPTVVSKELNILADAKPHPEGGPFIPSLDAMMSNHNLEDCSIFVDDLQIYPHPDDNPPPAYLIGRVSDFFDQIELQGSLKIQRGNQILFQQNEDQLIIPIADEIKKAIIHYQQYVEMEFQGAKEAYLDELKAGMVLEKGLNHRPGQASKYVIQEENAKSTDQTQEFKQTKNIVDDAKAQEVFRATRHLINEGFSRGYFTIHDFDNRDIIEYHATQGNLLLKGNKITGELLDHCLDEDMAAKIIQDSQFDQVLVKHLNIEENQEEEYYREYEFYIDGDKLKIYEIDPGYPRSDLIIFGNMATGEIYENSFNSDMPAAGIMHGFRVVAGYIPKDATLDSSIQITAENINQAALDTISIHGQDGVFEGEIFRFEAFQGNAKITLNIGDICVFEQGQLNVAIPPTALAKLQAIPGQVHQYKHQIQIQTAKNNQGSSTQVEPKLCKA